MAVPENPPSKQADQRSFWTPGRVVITLVAAGLLIVWGVSSWKSRGAVANKAPANRVTNAPNNAQPPVISLNLPPELRDTKLQTLDGESLKLSDFADKVLVLNIWATWCGPCRLEMPELVKISNEYGSRGLVVLGLATSYNERNDPVHVKEYVRAQNVPYKIIWDDGTLAAPLVQMVNAASVIPQSFVISRDGRIVKHFQGFNPYTTPQAMRQAIEDALNDKG
jgi:thiol-disulfide isomerase/thioredoxin